MAKIGIRKIKIVEKKYVPDAFFDKSGLLPSVSVGFEDITFVQDSAILTDEMSEDENGIIHSINLTFSIRADFDYWKKIIYSYVDKPVIIMVNANDGKNYVIGGKNAPAYITANSSYNKINVRELVVECKFKNINGLSEIKL